MRSGLCKNGTAFSTDFSEPVENRHGVYLFGRKRGRIKNKMRDVVRWKDGRRKGMNTGVGKLHQMLFYAGLEPEEYQACLPEIQLYFCEKMKGLGYQPMVYFNWHQSENLYYLSELEDFPFWLALYQDRMRYPWKVEMWQYTCTGRVPGINGDVDINVYMP